MVIHDFGYRLVLIGMAYLSTQMRANVATFLNNTCYFDNMEIMSALNVNTYSILQDISVEYYFILFTAFTFTIYCTQINYSS